MDYVPHRVPGGGALLPPPPQPDFPTPALWAVPGWSVPFLAAYKHTTSIAYPAFDPPAHHPDVQEHYSLAGASVSHAVFTFPTCEMTAPAGFQKFRLLAVGDCSGMGTTVQFRNDRTPTPDSVNYTTVPKTLADFPDSVTLSWSSSTAKFAWSCTLNTSGPAHRFLVIMPLRPLESTAATLTAWVNERVLVTPITPTSLTGSGAPPVVQTTASYKEYAAFIFGGTSSDGLAYLLNSALLPTFRSRAYRLKVT